MKPRSAQRRKRMRPHPPTPPALIGVDLCLPRDVSISPDETEWGRPEAEPDTRDLPEEWRELTTGALSGGTGGTAL